MDAWICRAARPSEADPAEYVLSDETIDRMGDSIVADGWDLAAFKRHPIALFNHNKDAVIGRWENVRVEGKRLLGRLALARAGTSRLVDEVRSLWDQGLLRAVSVGFRPLKYEPLSKDAEETFGPFRFLKQQLLEVSVVSVPANENALQIGRSFILPADIQRQIFGKPASQDPLSRLLASRVPAKPLQTRGLPMSTLSKRIELAQHDLNAYRDKLNELSAIEDPSDDDAALIDDITDNLLPAAEKTLKRLEKMEKSIGFSAAEPSEPSGQQVIVPEKRPFALPKKHVDPADLMIRAMSIGVRAFGTQTPIEQAMQDMYGNDEATKIVLRAAVNPANTTTTGYAAELVQTVNVGFLDRLMAASIYGPLSAAGSRYDLGRNGSIKIPIRSATPRASGSWVGEGAPKPVKKIGLSVATLTPHKLAVITTFTEELAMQSVPAIEGVLRKAMADDTSEALDGFLIDAVASSASRPAGLLAGVTPIVAAATGTQLEKIVADINALIAPMEAAGGGANVVLIMNPAQARKLGMVQTTTGDFAFGSAAEAASKFGLSRIIATTTVAAGVLIAVDADWFATATGDTPRFAVSTEATLHEEDTTPLPLSATGTPNTVAAPMRSLFQTDSVAIRLSLFVTWTMVRASMVQTITGVGW